MSVIKVSLGKKNKVKSNAPSGSKPQSDIIYHMSDGTEIKNGSGWEVWEYEGKWFHLGGNPWPGDKKGTPTIYMLKDNKWVKRGVDQSTAPSLYEHLNSQRRRAGASQPLRAPEPEPEPDY